MPKDEEKRSKLSAGMLKFVMDTEGRLSGSKSQRGSSDEKIEDIFPPGHPVRVAHERAKVEYKEGLRRRREAHSGKSSLKRREQRRQQAADAEAHVRKARDTVRTVNGKIEQGMVSLVDLLNTVQASREELDHYRTLKVQVDKLCRMVVAMQRGLDSLRLRTSHILED